MDVFLAGLPLAGVRIVVAGEGEAAEAKARLFAGSPAEVVRLGAAAAETASHYQRARLAFIALSGDAAARAAEAARAAGSWVNVVDRPELCDFTTPAFVDRGAVVGAIATGGRAPLLAAELRREWEARWPAGLGAVATLIGDLQEEARAALPEVAARRAWLRRLLDGEAPRLALAGDAEGARALAREGLGDRARQGRIALLEPPHDPELLSLRALAALGRADLIVAADRADPAVLALARRDAPVRQASAAGPEAVAAEARSGASVICVGPAEVFSDYGWSERLPVA